jgi:hypothetical protein
MRRLLTVTGCLFLLTPTFGAGWVSMFDGQTLEGWKASEKPEQWKVENGEIVGRGDRSHLFWMKEECGDCEFKAKVLINKGGNSGMFFRTEWRETPGFPRGYEAQVNRSHRDPVKTGSLYNLVKVYQQLTPEETWFEQHIIARGNHIVIKVNGKTAVDFIDDKNTYMKGYLALQQHDPTGVVRYKDLMYRKL